MSDVVHMSVDIELNDEARCGAALVLAERINALEQAAR